MIDTRYGSSKLIRLVEWRRKLFPIRLADMKTLRAWECLDSDNGKDLAEAVHKHHLPDFSHWKNHGAFEAALRSACVSLPPASDFGVTGRRDKPAGK